MVAKTIAKAIEKVSHASVKVNLGKNIMFGNIQKPNK